MRFTQAFPARPAWYDRNATNQNQGAIVTAAAPHTNTIRWTYTVPSARKAFVEILTVTMVRNGAAAPLGFYENFITYTPNAGVAKIPLIVWMRTNNVGDRVSQAIGQGMTLYAGDVINASDDDASTGGSVDYHSSIKAAEFDA